MLEVVSVTNLNEGIPLLVMSDKGQVKLLQRFLFMGLDVLVFAVVAMLPLFPGQCIETKQEPFDPSTTRAFGANRKEMLPLEKLPVFGWLSLH